MILRLFHSTAGAFGGVTAAVFGLGLCAAAVAEKDHLILKHAETIENSIVNGALFSVLRGNVLFEYDSTLLRCDKAQWLRGEGKVSAEGRIEVTRGTQRLTCQRIDYIRDSALLTAWGNVVFVDSYEGVRVSGQKCRYHLNTRVCVLEGTPRVFRFDTTSAETLIIAGTTMQYVDSLKRTSAVGSVVVTKGPLHSESGIAHYFTDSEVAQLRDKPSVSYREHQLRGDSIDLRFSNDTLRAMSVTGSTHAVYFEYDNNDTSCTQVWGDSISMLLTAAGVLDSVRIFRNVKSTYGLGSDSSRLNKVMGREMILVFVGPRTHIRQATVAGSATSIYFLENNQGRNEASGDTLSVWFRQGRACRLRLAGGVRGVYFPPEPAAGVNRNRSGYRKKSS